MHKNISITKALPDMILAMPVKDQQNRILAAQGTKLTEKLIHSLQKRGCLKLNIESQQILSQRQYDQLILDLSLRFKGIPAENWLQAIHSQLKTRYDSQLAS